MNRTNPVTERVLIAGAGPVGLVAAANLVRHGVPVTVFESGGDLSMESRASTFHPPTLDMLGELGVVQPLIAQGLIAPKFQYRNRRDGVIAEFDFGDIADQTRHPFRLQCEQSKLTRIIYDRLRGAPDLEIVFSSPVRAVTQNTDSVTVTVERDGRSEAHSYRWLIGADGARSDVRRSLDIEFEGFTWPDRYLVVSTPFDFHSVIPGLATVSYVADPVRWHFLLGIPGLWRVMFRIAPEESDELALSAEFVTALMAEVVPGIDRYQIDHTTLYRVHQRVASTFRKHRAFLIGDAAHVNNPLGGMGMNGGIHDAMNLTERLAAVWRGEKAEAELDRFDLQRRLVTKEYVERQSIQNKRNLEAADNGFRDFLRQTAADPTLRREYLLKVSMIGSLRRAEQLG
ncbi:MAG TPA: FAD-dependent monooxygenase [Bradyrhizobium sp.]|uniref:FAD-dependent oxidoreductase n=1 Tax=Bradyrhizobium sp. TaxID=376 RepID=UPI002D7E4298|nr:FAD-dependent monooxygenase [Bradyrhizobium sp.]HET7887357.1 FAD-dependent monooxygenase [Bradyrhizobium sp.]